MTMNTNNYRRMMFLPVLIIVAEMYIIGYSGLDKNNDVYETVEDGVLYTTGELDSTVYDEPAAETENADKTAEGTSDSAAAASANVTPVENTAESVAPAAAENTEKININTADAETLMKLPGIGEKMSERIIETRNRMGGYKAIEDILNVEGIGEKKFQKIKELITV